MSQTDTLYQQLRSHLAYLKLGAAAEALPAALDTARTDKQNPTEFLEQLLRVEVDATEARRLKGRQRFANIPTPWRLTDFDFAAQPSVSTKPWSAISATRPLRRGRQRTLPSHQPEIPQRLNHPHNQPRSRQLGRHIRRHHRRRRHARPATPPLRRLQHHRRQLPPPSPPSPQQTTHETSQPLSSNQTQGGEFR